MKIQEIKIRSLRGIAEILTVPLHEKNGGPAQTTLIFGDNGAGKSSIVDAIEFLIRGQVSRRGVGGRKQRKELRNLFLDVPPAVIAKTDSGLLLARGDVKGVEEAKILKGRSTPEGIGSWPVAIRRQDVEEFWRVNDDRRLEFFYDYFLPAGSSFADEHRRAEAIRLHEEAVDDHLLALDRLEPYLGVWRGDIPEHVGAIKAFRAVLMRQNGLRKEERKELEYLVDDFEFTLIQRNHASGAAQAARNAQTIDLEGVAAALDSISGAVAEDFRCTTGLNWLSNVAFHVSNDGRLSVDLITTDGRVCDPRDILSEAYLDLLALMVIMDLHLALAKGTERRFVALDDVFQSVDAPLRQRALEHIVSRFEGWQLIITLHDGLWLKATTKIFEGAPSIRVLRIRNRGHGASPAILDERIGPLADVEGCIADNSRPVPLSMAAGRALESLCHELSFSWKVAVQRPLRDEYKLSYLWRILQPVLERSSDPALRQASLRLKTTQFIRNEAAHPNETAESLTDAEARQFADDVRTLWHRLSCQRCQRLVRSPQESGPWALQKSCGHSD
ncbi:AAA family ATPase [Micromonospora foliorum]|uniref:AAA family ATPase n=1 Tax=Micromonospora foliorum TaxID=2911210 RepID=UPI001EE96D7D|nr:AAA family ATPase [Micromonospora foliorum]MCG5440784.1 AAA family ATPase [Micromonospora foliorum]